MNLQKNQKEVKGKGDRVAIYTFRDMTVREVLKAEHLWQGFVIHTCSFDLTSECWDSIVEPIAVLLLTGAVITCGEEAHRIDNFGEAEYFRGKYEELLNAIRAAADCLGFTVPSKSDFGLSQDKKAESPTSNPS